VLDRVISSYTPTVRALAYARGREATTPPARALIVAMPTTPGASPLRNVVKEAAWLRQRLPSPTVLIEDSLTANERTPTKSAVTAHLPEAGIAHFSCHAASHPSDPSQSYLVLHDHQEEPLTVASLVPIRLHRAQLAFLSACQTARNQATYLLDEALHLTAAFQLAGYPHVIGTLWSIYDNIATDVAVRVYSHLETGPRTFDLTLTAQALHHAIRDLRDSRNLGDSPSLWAAFTHTGA
jgi:CHAT domain-containing protein